MTRFQIVGIFDDTIYTTTEFNGDGYFSGYGHEVCKELKEAKTFEDYKRIVESINEHFKYEEKLIYDNVKVEELDFFKNKSDYYNIWFSDYLYIKNFTQEDKTVIDEKGAEIILKPNGYVTLYFGELDVETYENIKSVEKCDINEFTIIINKAKDLYWDVQVDENEITFQRYTPLGEDFSFSVDKEVWDQQLKRYCEEFDVDEHVRLWVNDSMFSIRDLLEDAEWIEQALEELKDGLLD